MTEIALHGPTTGSWRRFTEGSREVLLGIAEGFAAAHRYRRLANMSDATLARRGLTREDLPWVAVFGEPRPR
jgi:hypothetical protein